MPSLARPRFQVAAALLAAGVLFAAPAGPAAADQASDGGGSGPESGMSLEQAWENAKRDWRELQDASGDALEQAREEFRESWSRVQELMADSEGAAPPPDPSEPGAEAGGN